MAYEIPERAYMVKPSYDGSALYYTGNKGDEWTIHSDKAKVLKGFTYRKLHGMIQRGELRAENYVFYNADRVRELSA